MVFLAKVEVGHNRTMRLAAFVGAIVLILVAVFQGKDGQPLSGWFVIQNIEVKGVLKYTSIDKLKLQYHSLIGQSLLTLSLGDAVKIAESPQWVETAEVRKIWPNTLQISVYEHTPLAYWNERQLITTKAVIITPSVVPNLPLPKLIGPEDASDVVLDQFGLISQALALSSLRIAELKLEPRGAWDIQFTNGISVKLGREDVLERLQRFMAVYKSDLSGRIDQISSVDARYPHGVAVAWKKTQ